MAPESVTAVLYGAAFGWAAYLALFTIPGVLRVMRSRS